MASLPAVLTGLVLAISCADDPITPSTSDDTGADDDVGIQCTPGSEVGCMCPDGRAGTQTCAANGMELGGCMCGPGGAEAGDSTDDGETEDSGSSDSGGAGLCGNGMIDEGEQCDDGNSRYDDACSNDCILACGLQWEQIIEPEDSGSFGNDVAVGPDNEVVVVGAVESDDGSTNDVWIAKLDAEGLLLWEDAYDTAGGNDFGDQVAIDDSGNILVVGTVRNESGDDDILVRMLDPNGGELWSDQVDGAFAGNDSSGGAAFDASGNAYASGTIRNADGDTDLWVRKYSPSGSETWTTTHTAPGNGTYSLDNGVGVAVDGDGNVYAQIEAYVNFETRDVGLVKFGPDGGAALWEQFPLQGGPAHTHRGAGVNVDESGDIVWAINFDSVSSSWTFWVFKTDADGNEVWMADVDDVGVGSRHTIEAIGVADDGRIGLMLTADPPDADYLGAVVATVDADGLAGGCTGGVDLPLGSIIPVGGTVDGAGNIYGAGLTTISPGTQRRWVTRFRGAATVR